MASLREAENITLAFYGLLLVIVLFVAYRWLSKVLGLRPSTDDNTPVVSINDIGTGLAGDSLQSIPPGGWSGRYDPNAGG